VFPIVPFTHCLEHSITYSSTLDSGAALPAHIIFDPIALTYTIIADDNANAGTVIVRLIGTSNGAADYDSFFATINPNLPPILIAH